MMDKKERMLEIGTLIRKKRKEKGLSMAALGMACGYSAKIGEVFVWQWETANRPVPPAKYRAVASMLGIPLEELVP